MAKAIRREDESIEQLLRRFNKKRKREGIKNELIKREYYLTPNERRRRTRQQLRRIKNTV